MKRSKGINLQAMRKKSPQKQTTLAISLALALGGCDSSEESRVFKTLDECIAYAPEKAQECRQAYNYALLEAERSGPKYTTLRDCEYEFGAGRCHQSQSNTSWFVPAMAGFMVARLLDRERYNPYYSSPLYTSTRYGSPMYDHWYSSDGYNYGSTRNSRITTHESDYVKKPAVNRTIKRGGFGSIARAKSSWSSRSSGGRSSWGG